MNDLLGDWKNIAIGLLGALVAVLSWIGTGVMKRLNYLERHAVLKQDLDKYHQENLGNFREIKAHLERQDKGREDLKNVVHRIDKRLAVVQTRQGYAPGDTGEREAL